MKLLRVACLLLLVIGVVGCQPDDGVAKLTGSLLIDGQPAPEGVALTFDPTERGRRGSAGFTDSEGNFKAIYSINRDGVHTGECVARLANGIEMEPPKEGRAVNRPFPEEYYTEIKTFTVKPGKNSIQLEITSKK